jgi:hypothetical protein
LPGVTENSAPLSAVIAGAIDAAGLGATAPELILELQTDLGHVAALATVATERGRRPFRPPPGWPQRLGQLGLTLYNIADQTGIDLDEMIRERAAAVTHAAHAAAQHAPTGWPFQD